MKIEEQRQELKDNGFLVCDCGDKFYKPLDLDINNFYGFACWKKEKEQG